MDERWLNITTVGNPYEVEITEDGTKYRHRSFNSNEDWKAGQPPAPAKRFPVIELFGPTLQGEGQTIGIQTFFIRLGGCDYRCEKCDSLFAVLPQSVKQNATPMTCDEIFQGLVNLAEQEQSACKFVTLSGGNPCMWDVSALINALKRAGWEVAVETQGSIWQDWLYNCDYITISPKGPGMGESFESDKFKVFYDSLIENLVNPVTTVKIVIFDQRDIEFAKEFMMTFPSTPLFLSLGNPWPPAPANQSPHDASSWRDALLERMGILFQDIKQIPELSRARFLPQMHTLIWGNERCR